MLSNVSKSADVLRGNTEMQDLWEEVEKETPVADLRGPRRLKNEIMNGLIQNEKEARDELERQCHVRQQRNNWYMSESAKNLTKRSTDMSTSERKKIRDRLQKRPGHTPPRPKSPTGQGHILATGDQSPQTGREAPPKKIPNSRAAVSSPGTLVKSSRRRSAPKFEGLMMQDFYSADWKPSFTYRPAVQAKPWENLEGFAVSTRTLERRKMNPFVDINSWQGNKYSAKQQFNSNAYVRPLDVKGNLGAEPVQRWKETLREDFARDSDNFSSNAHDAFLDDLRVALANTSSFSNIA